MAIEQDQVMQLLLQHRGKLLGSIRAMVGDYHLAEDVFQEVSILAINKREEIDSPEQFPAWIRQAARYRALDSLRARDRIPRSIDSGVLDLLESHWRQFDTQPDTEYVAVLEHCLDKLSPYARRLVRTRYAEGKRGDQLAQALGRSMNTVYVALTRAHHTLRACLERGFAKEHGHG